MNNLNRIQHDAEQGRPFLAVKRRRLACVFIFLAGLGCARGGAPVNVPAGPPYAKMSPVPIVAIHPEGWLRQYLVNQRNGLTGHLEEAGYPFNTIA